MIKPHTKMLYFSNLLHIINSYTIFPLTMLLDNSNNHPVGTLALVLPKGSDVGFDGGFLNAQAHVLLEFSPILSKPALL